MTIRLNPIRGRLALALFLLLGISSPAPAESTEPVIDNPVGTMPIPAEIDHKHAMNTCVNAALGREWNVAKKEEDWIKITLKHRSWDATVYFVVKEDVIEMYSDSYVVDKKTGERKKKKDPDGWIKYLIKDINLDMAITASELRMEAEGPVLDNLVETIAVPEGVEPAEAMNTCVNAAIGRGWHIVSNQDGLLRINLKQRDWNATLYLVLSDGSIEVYSDTYIVNTKTGERKKKKDPDVWIKHLKTDIDRHFDKVLYID